jgi:hypothetical protein
MPCQHYVQNLAAHGVDFRCVAVDNHALGCWLAAGGDKAFPPLNLNLAQSACPIGEPDISQRAQIGNIDAVIQRCFQDSFPFGRLDLNAVYSQRNDICLG